MSTSIITQLELRRLVAQVSDRAALDAHLESGARTLYSGFDPTAESLHIGHLVPLWCLRRFQLRGHRPIVLVGGATGLIGDPSFKSGERTLNDAELVASWVERIRAQVSRFVDLEGSAAGRVVNNLDWIRNLDAITFLRETGKHFSVNAMIHKESVRARLEREGEGISYTEFSYMVLQALDYRELAERYDCTLQLGGSDQWGNITAGMDLVRRSLRREVFGLTLPLVTKADGTKFGKTETGAVWLDPARTSPYSFYQFWLNTADADVVNFLGFFTFIDQDEMAEIAATVQADPGRREAQRRLAREVTGMVHGSEALVSAERITEALFGGTPGALTEEDLRQLRQDGMACTRVADAEPLPAVLAAGGLAASRGAARKLIESGGISINGAVAADPTLELRRENALYGRYHLIRRGKKAWHLAVHGGPVGS